MRSVPFQAKEKADHHLMSLLAEDGMRRRTNGEEIVVKKSMRRPMKAQDVGMTWEAN